MLKILTDILCRHLTIPQAQKIWEWCQEFGMVSPPESPLADVSYNPNTMPFWKEILENFTDNSVRQITVIKPSQVGFTYCINQIALYCMIHDRSNILIAYPNDGTAERYSKQKLKPFIMAQKNINNWYNERHSSKFLQNFGTKNIAITGLEKKTAMTMNTYKTVVLDEMSNIPVSVGGGNLGDPVILAQGRVQTFAEESKIIIGGTLILEDGILEREFRHSSQKYYHMPCPKCGELQAFLFRDLDDELYKYLKYEIDEHNNVIKGSEYIICHNTKCNFRITDRERIKMIRDPNAKWISNNINTDDSHQGYFLNALYNPFQKLIRIAEAHYKAVSNPEREILQAFTNEYEARAWKLVDFHLDNIHDSVLSSRFEIPNDVVILTMGVDVQQGKDNNNHLVYQIDGWGKNMQRWAIDYGIIYGDLRDDKIWDELVNIMYQPRYKDLNIDSEPYIVECGMIDSQGGFIEDVMRACHRDYVLRHEDIGMDYIEYPELYPIRGAGGKSSSTVDLLQYWNYVDATTFKESDKIINEAWWKKVNRLNTFQLKEQLFNDLAIPVNHKNKDKFGLTRFVQWDGYTGDYGFNQSYFKGIKSEAKVYKITAKGSNSKYTKTRERNEPVDTSAYSRAAYIFFIRSVSSDHPKYDRIVNLHSYEV